MARRNRLNEVVELTEGLKLWQKLEYITRGQKEMLKSIKFWWIEKGFDTQETVGVTYHSYNTLLSLQQMGFGKIDSKGWGKTQLYTFIPVKASTLWIHIESGHTGDKEFNETIRRYKTCVETYPEFAKAL